MPRLSDSMREGAISRWLVADGAEVTRGQELLEVETDKATMTYEAEDSGVLHILVTEGQDVPVGHVIATIGGWTRSAPQPPVAGPVAAPASGRVAVSPLLRRFAKDLGVDLTSVHGTGPGGKIRREDIADAATTPAPSNPAPSAPAPSISPAPSTAAGQVRRPLTHRQRLIAGRMLESKRTAPDFALTMTVDVTRLLQLRAELRSGQPEAIRPTVNDFVVKACALALVAHPLLGGHLDGEVVVLPAEVGVGIAVALEGSLLVPVIRRANEKSLQDIADESREIAARARAGTIDAASMQGGTFTISNLGPFGIRSFTPIINSGQAAILGVGAAVETCVPRDGSVAVRSLMELNLTCDHRFVYGADGARFLQTLRELLESPLALLLE